MKEQVISNNDWVPQYVLRRTFENTRQFLLDASKGKADISVPFTWYDGVPAELSTKMKPDGSIHTVNLYIKRGYLTFEHMACDCTEGYSLELLPEGNFALFVVRPYPIGDPIVGQGQYNTHLKFDIAIDSAKQAQRNS